MNKKQTIILIVVLLLLSVASLWCFWIKKYNFIPDLTKVLNSKKQTKLYVCPMHPAYNSDKPGTCPICGMTLIEKPTNEHADHNMNMKSSFDGDSIDINSNKQQLIGIATRPAKKINVDKEIKALGIVSADERLINHIHTKFSGYIEKVFADYEGKYIAKGSSLFTIYSPELVSTQEEYLLALKAEKELSNTNYDLINQSQKTLKEASLRRLKLWDIGDQEIEELEKIKQVKKNLTIYSSYGGFITKRMAFEGLTVDPSKPLYEITDLSRVWVLAEVYEQDLPSVSVGQKVRVQFPYDNNNSFQGTVTYVYPELDPTNRTVKVRAEVYNSNYQLKPNMYVDAYLVKNLGMQIVVPKSSVINTGERNIVFVKSGGGSFVPKEVQLGQEFNLRKKDGSEERYQIISSGLMEGEEIVTEGNFMLDSESNLQSALNQMAGGHQH